MDDSTNSENLETQENAESQETEDSEETKDTSAFSEEVEKSAEKILHAVNKIIDSNDKIRALYKKLRLKALIRMDDDEEEDEKTLFMQIGKQIITHYSDRPSISGGLSGLPSMSPGFGMVVSLVGASAVDIVLMLKFEIEMALCLCLLAGFDIDDERSRLLAYTLATASSKDILSNDEKSLPSLSVVRSAFWDYSVRQLSKHIIKNIARILCFGFSKGLANAIPFVGIAVGASFNNVMTKRTGLCCLDALWLRRHLSATYGADDPNDDIVYDAEILDSDEV